MNSAWRKLQTSKLHISSFRSSTVCSREHVNGSHSTLALRLSLEAFDGKTWNKFIAAAAIKLVQTAVQVIRKAKWSKFDMPFFVFHCLVFFDFLFCCCCCVNGELESAENYTVEFSLDVILNRIHWNEYVLCQPHFSAKTAVSRAQFKLFYRTWICRWRNFSQPRRKLLWKMNFWYCSHITH